MKKKIKIGFQGERGAYSHLAALEVFPEAEITGCTTFEEAFKLGRDNSEYKIIIPYNIISFRRLTVIKPT